MAGNWKNMSEVHGMLPGREHETRCLLQAIPAEPSDVVDLG